MEPIDDPRARSTIPLTHSQPVFLMKVSPAEQKYLRDDPFKRSGIMKVDAEGKREEVPRPPPMDQVPLAQLQQQQVKSYVPMQQPALMNLPPPPMQQQSLQQDPIRNEAFSKFFASPHPSMLEEAEAGSGGAVQDFTKEFNANNGFIQ